MSANNLSFNQISAEMNAIHAQAIGAQPLRAINTGAVMTQAQAALLGADIQLDPLTITENGTYDPPAGKGFGKVTADVPNPNSVETITGTLANPWGDYSLTEIANMIISNNASIRLSSIVTNNVALPVTEKNGSVGVQAITFISTTPETAGVLAWSTTQNKFFVWSHDTDTTTQIPDTTPCIVTIIHHPLPEDNE